MGVHFEVRLKQNAKQLNTI